MLSFYSYKEFFQNKNILSPTEKEGEEILAYAEELGEENIGLCRLEGLLLARLFDGGEYSYRIFDSEDGELYKKAAEAVREYSVKEETSLVFTDVSADSLGRLAPLFRYSRLDAADADRSRYNVKILSESGIQKELPEYEFADILLSPVTEEDIPEYARLCRDETGLEFWGYDYRGDGENISDEYFYLSARAENERGTALTLGARLEGKLIGEVGLYAFDYKGGCEIAFRLLPEYRGKGLGDALISALLAVASDLELLTLYASVNKNNIPSVKLLSEYMDLDREEEDILYFSLGAEEQ